MHSIWTEVPGFLAHNWQELVGSLTGALCVWLLVKQNIWNWPIGITNNIFYRALSGWHIQTASARKATRISRSRK